MHSDLDPAYDEMVGMADGLITKFLAAGLDYGDAFKELGLAGQYSDMHRKMKKLKRELWDGKRLTRESAEEVLGDLFGHILISLYLLRHGDDEHIGGIEDSIPVEPIDAAIAQARALGKIDDAGEEAVRMILTGTVVVTNGPRDAEYAEPIVETGSLRMPNADGRLGGELTPTFTTMAVDQSDGTLISSIEQFKRIFNRDPSDEERDGMAEDVRRARAREAQLNSEGANAPSAVERGAQVWEGSD